MTYQITRQIELDAGHRIPDHKGQCFNLHGHRYKVEVAVSRFTLDDHGPERGMIMDYGGLKDIMMEKIHKVCDHKMMLYVHDPILNHMIDEDQLKEIQRILDARRRTPFIDVLTTKMIPIVQKLVIFAKVPTAENLAAAWYDSVCDPIEDATGALPDYLRVWETPNVTATYLSLMK